MEALRRALDDLDATRSELTSELEAAGMMTNRLRELLDGGTPLESAWSMLDMSERRARLVATVGRFQEAFRRTRTAWIRHLHDVEGLNLTRIAEMLGVSRQYVSRLYTADD